MSETAIEPWAWGIIVPVVVGLIAALWKLFGKTTEKGESQNAKDIARVEKRLDDHIVEDVKMHERIVRIETKNEMHDKEIGTLREKTTGMKHDILNEVTRVMMTWYNDIIERLMKFFERFK